MRLITAIKIQAKCELNSELKTLSAEKRKWIADIVEERVPCGLASIEEWNEVISCFKEMEPEENNEKAKKRLLSILREEHN